MITRVLITLVLTVVCATPVPLLAADEFNVFGINTELSCGKYLTDISTRTTTEKVSS